MTLPKAHTLQQEKRHNQSSPHRLLLVGTREHGRTSTKTQHSLKKKKACICFLFHSAYVSYFTQSKNLIVTNNANKALRDLASIITNLISYFSFTPLLQAQWAPAMPWMYQAYYYLGTLNWLSSQPTRLSTT